jgi:hypothetical protein
LLTILLLVWSALAFFPPRIEAQTLSSMSAPAVSASPDTILFLNRDRLVGRFVSATNSGVSFIGERTDKSQGTGTAPIFIQWSAIDTIYLTPTSVCVLTNPSPQNVKVNPIVSSEIQVKGNAMSLILHAANPLPSVTISTLVSITEGSVCPQPPPAPHGWGGQLQTQGGLITSTQDQYSLGGSLLLGHATQNQKALKYQKTSIDLQANYGESKKPGASPVITRLYEAGAQQDVYFTGNQDADGDRRYGGARVFAVTDFYDNLSLGMRLEQAYGIGAGWDRQHGKQTYGFSVDVRYIGENLYSPGKDQHLAAADVGENFKEKLHVKAKPIILSESASILPAFNDSNALQARCIVKATMPLTQRLSIGLQESDDYLRNSPPKSKQNYSNLQVTFTYVIGPQLAQ